MKISIPYTITAISAKANHGFLYLRPDAPARALGEDDLMIRGSADQFATFQVGLPAKVTLTLESPDEAALRDVLCRRPIGMLTEDEVAHLNATGGAAVQAEEVPKDATSQAVPSDKDLVDAARVADLAALKARARCAEMVLTASTPDAAETLARAAQNLGLRS